MSQPAVPHTETSTLAGVVASMGSQQFGREMLHHLRALSGADHCSLFVLDQNSLKTLATSSWSDPEANNKKVVLYANQQYWRKDPTISEARQRLQSGTCVLRMKVNELHDTELRTVVYPTVRDRILICGRPADTTYCVSVLRSQVDAFPDGAFDRLCSVSDVLIALLAKHADLLQQFPSPGRAWASMDEIESCLAAMTQLSRREMEVCARVLYGLSALGTSIDLGIGEESVRTYRTRAYRRLSIGGERELFKWYLDLWHEWRVGARPPVGQIPCNG